MNNTPDDTRRAGLDAALLEACKKNDKAIQRAREFTLHNKFTEAAAMLDSLIAAL